MSPSHDIYLFPSPAMPKDVVLRPIPPIIILNLIQKSLQFSREARIEFISLNNAIIEPLTPNARRSHQYLLVREFLMKGCRKASMLVLNPYKRSQAYGILVSACEEIFNYGYKPEIITYHNSLLDKIIGTH